MGKKRTRRIAALLLSLLLTLPAPSALAAESALESASSASSQAPEGESSGEESAAQPAEESSAPESSQPAGEESQPGEGESSQEEPSSLEPSSSQEESSSQEPEEESSGEESSGEESGISMEDSQQETFASYPLLVVGGHEAYMSGEAGARFYPDRAMTRAEMAQVLYNLLASYPPVTGGSFSDVSDSAWYATAVNTLVELDVLSGYEDGTFRPNNAVTRAEFVTAVCKCFDLTDGADSGFSDVSGWASGYINAAVERGWIVGMGDGTFQPNANLTRAQVTPILNKALERTGSGFAADAVTPEFVDVPSSHWAYEHIAEAADPVGSAIETGCTVRVTATNGLNLRSSASTTSSVVTVLPTGAELTVTSVESNGWLGVRTGSGRTGYVSGEFVEYVSGPTDTPDPEPEPDPDPDGFEVGQTVRVTAEPSLRLRSGPGTNYEAITSLATGVRLTIT
ncbi:MAG: S-layer homology domain-containing protein, partial [Acutalibacter sp.]